MGFSRQEIGAGCRALLESEVQLTRLSAGFPGGADRAPGIQDVLGALRVVSLGWISWVLDSTL